MIDMYRDLFGKKLRKNISVGVWILLQSIFTCIYYSDMNWIEEFQEIFQWTSWEELATRRILKNNDRFKLMKLIKIDKFKIPLVNYEREWFFSQASYFAAVCIPCTVLYVLQLSVNLAVICTFYRCLYTLQSFVCFTVVCKFGIRLYVLQFSVNLAFVCMSCSCL